MNTELNDRIALAKLIAPLREEDLKQLLAYAAGYEAGKASQTPNFSTQTKNRDHPNGELLQ